MFNKAVKSNSKIKPIFPHEVYDTKDEKTRIADEERMCAILNASRAEGPRIKYRRTAMQEEEKDIMTKLADIEKD